MKLIKYCFFIALFFLTSCQGQEKEVVTIKVSDLQTALSTYDTIQLIDVRTPEEWKNGVIGNPIKIDVTASDFEEKALKILDKSKPVYLYCRSGGRSLIAADMLFKKGFKVYNVEGGYLKWQEKTK